MRTRRVLVTGAGGQVAAAALPLLAADHDVVALTHRTGVPGPTVTGDITRPGLGLPGDVRRELAARVDTVVHCAADTGFGPDTAHTLRVNAEGTRNVAEFTAEAGATLVHLSSAFVARRELARGNAALFGGSDTAPVLAYLDSKLAAERIVRELGVPTVTLLPSVVVGDSHTGRSQRHQGLTATLFCVVLGWVPWLPGQPDTTLDLVPSDLVARAIATAVTRGESGGRHWVTAGTTAPRLDRLCDLAHEIAHDHGIHLPRPRLVPPPEAPALLNRRAPGARTTRMRQMLGQAAVLHGGEPFPSDHHTLLGAPPATPAATENAFRQTFTHVVREHLWSRPTSTRRGAPPAPAA
ncbi:SDR family oxidoreductase [Streptomyces sp. NPDC050560]|uniref:SDR family oxidoreductase n=1 Tax=Streptomyces sp. NPDC050560 TaxID=3365630 RepID=UPI0037B1F4A1